MGLHKTRIPFIAQELPIVDDGNFDFNNPHNNANLCVEQEAPVASIFDVMTDAYSIRPPVPSQPETFETRTVARSRGDKNVDFATYYPCDIYETFASRLYRKIETAVSRKMNVTVVLVFDKEKFVPKEKARERESRKNKNNDYPPYDLSEYKHLSAINFTDAGCEISHLCNKEEVEGKKEEEEEEAEDEVDANAMDSGRVTWQSDSDNEDAMHLEDPFADEKEETKKKSKRPPEVEPDAQSLIEVVSTFKVETERIMNTRDLRPRWFAYLVTKLCKDDRFYDITLIIDYVAGVPPIEVFKGHVYHRDDLYNEQGEAEVAAIGYAAKLTSTHHVQVLSGDTDLVVLSLMHGSKMINTFTVGITYRATIATINACKSYKILKEGLWDWSQLCLGLMLNGTDYIEKRLILFNVNVKCVIHAVRSYCTGQYTVEFGAEEKDCAQTHTIDQVLADVDSFTRLIKSIYSLFYVKRRGLPLWRPEVNHEIPHFQIMNDAELVGLRKVGKKGMVGLPEPSDIAKGYEQVKFNWEYWKTLQNSLQTKCFNAIVNRKLEGLFLGQSLQ